LELPKKGGGVDRRPELAVALIEAPVRLGEVARKERRDLRADIVDLDRGLREDALQQIPVRVIANGEGLPLLLEKS
jgi:hypothetical protein